MWCFFVHGTLQTGDKKTMKDTEYLKQPETIKRFSKLIRDNAVYFKSHFFKKSFSGCSVVNNVFKP